MATDHIFGQTLSCPFQLSNNIFPFWLESAAISELVRFALCSTDQIALSTCAFLDWITVWDRQRKVDKVEDFRGNEKQGGCFYWRGRITEAYSFFFYWTIKALETLAHNV